MAQPPTSKDTRASDPYAFLGGCCASSDIGPEREVSGTEGSGLPEHYYLDESDPDVLVLRRQDGTFVAAFSAQGATREGIVEAAKEDYYASLMSEQTGGGHEESDPAGIRG